MRYIDYLNAVIDRGIAAVREDYKDREPGHLEGAIAGFEACRDKSPRKLAELLIRAGRAVNSAYGNRYDTPLARKRGWWIRCYHAEVDWVCNCVSAVLQNQGMPCIASHHPTARAILLAAEIVGVKDEPTPINETVITCTVEV